RHRRPGRGAGAVVPGRRAHSRGGVECPGADAPDLAVGAAAPERAATPRAKALREAVVRLPLPDELSPLDDSQRPRDDPRLRRSRRTCAPLAAGAMAIGRLDR